MKRFIIFTTSLLMALSLCQCKKEVEADVTPSVGGLIEVCLTASFDSHTKIDIQSSDSVSIYWTAGDKVVLASPTSGFLGTLTLSKGEGTKNGTFSGTVETWSQAERLWVYYLGKGKEYDPSQDNKFTLDVTTQSICTLASIGDYMILKGQTNYLAPGQTRFGPINLFPVTSYAIFDTQSSGDFAAGTPVKIKNARNTAVFNFKTAQFENPTIADITLTVPSTSCYVALIPGTNALTFSDGTTEIEMNKTITEGCLYTANGNAISIEGKFIDLGLSVLWAKYNLGSYALTDCGDFYAWGETCLYYKSLETLLTSPNTSSNWSTTVVTGAGNTGVDGFHWQSYSLNKSSVYQEWATKPYESTSDLRIMKSANDVATKELGSKCHIPTKAEWEELVSGCNWSYDSTTNCYIATSKTNSRTLYLPAAGYIQTISTTTIESKNQAHYWTSNMTATYYDANAFYFTAKANTATPPVVTAQVPGISSDRIHYRCDGRNVRAVKTK